MQNLYSVGGSMPLRCKVCGKVFKRKNWRSISVHLSYHPQVPPQDRMSREGVMKWVEEIDGELPAPVKRREERVEERKEEKVVYVCPMCGYKPVSPEMAYCPRCGVEFAWE